MKKVIANFYLTIQFFCFKSRNTLKKKSELCDIKSQLHVVNSEF